MTGEEGGRAQGGARPDTECRAGDGDTTLHGPAPHPRPIPERVAGPGALRRHERQVHRRVARAIRAEQDAGRRPPRPRVSDPGPPHPFPWLAGPDHRRALAHLLIADPDVPVETKIAHCEHYRLRWSDRDLLAALRLANANGAMCPELASVLRALVQQLEVL